MKKLLLIPAAALMLGGCAGLDATSLSSASGKLMQALTITDAQIVSYTSQFIAESDAEHTVAGPTNAYTVRLKKITKNIAQDGINFKVYLTKDVNAFACADGSVRVYSGLMDIMTDNEILGVIGHEIGHVRNKDTRDAFKNALMVSAARDAISSTGGGVAALSASQLGDLGESFLSARYSQKQEYAADAYAYEYLKAHNINPWAMAMSFEKLASLQGSSAQSDALKQLFSSHPDIAARTKIMSERATKDGYKRPAK